MDPTEEFNKSAREFLDAAYSRLTEKGKEYELRHYNIDRYSQLMAQAELTGLTIEGVINVLMAKHITVICNLEKTMNEEEFTERALDVIAYLCLLNGIYKKVN